MTLSHDKNTPEISGRKRQFTLQDNTVIYAGSLVAINAQGHAVPASKTINLVCVGIAEQRADTSKGDTSVTVKNGTFGLFIKALDTISSSDIGKNVYIEDEETISINNDASSIAGTLFDASGNVAWIKI